MTREAQARPLGTSGRKEAECRDYRACDTVLCALPKAFHPSSLTLRMLWAGLIMGPLPFDTTNDEDINRLRNKN